MRDTRSHDPRSLRVNIKSAALEAFGVPLAVALGDDPDTLADVMAQLAERDTVCLGGGAQPFIIIERAA